MSLAQKKCIPCSGDIPPLDNDAINIFMKELDSDWHLTHDNKRLERTFKLKQFTGPMELANEIAKLSDDQWHHPDLHISFNELKVEIWTHKINALVESDFILAAKIDKIA